MKDKNDIEIKVGDLLFRKFHIRRRERSGARRVGIDMMGNEHICNDEGELGEPEDFGVLYEVKQSGACLIADKIDESPNREGAETFDLNGKNIHVDSGSIYMDEYFNSTLYEIVPEEHR